MENENRFWNWKWTNFYYSNILVNLIYYMKIIWFIKRIWFDLLANTDKDILQQQTISYTKKSPVRNEMKENKKNQKMNNNVHTMQRLPMNSE